MAAVARDSFVVGLIGDHIGGSLAGPLQEGEARAHGLSLAYRLVDSSARGLRPDDIGDVLRWAVLLGFDAVAVTHPFKNAVMEVVDEATPEAQALGASNLVLVRNGRTSAQNTDWLGFAEALSATLPDATGDRMVLVGAGGAGVAVGYGALRYGAAHLDIVDLDHERAVSVADRLGSLVGAERVRAASDLQGALAAADGLIQATPVGMAGHPGMPVAPELLRPDLWVADIVYFPLETELVQFARTRGCRVMTGGSMAVHQHVAAFGLITGVPADLGRMSRHFAALTGQQVALSTVGG